MKNIDSTRVVIDCWFIVRTCYFVRAFLFSAHTCIILNTNDDSDLKHFIVTSARSIVITWVCWFVCFACYFRCDFSKTTSPIFRKFGKDVHHYESETEIWEVRVKVRGQNCCTEIVWILMAWPWFEIFKYVHQIWHSNRYWASRNNFAWNMTLDKIQDGVRSSSRGCTFWVAYSLLCNDLLFVYCWQLCLDLFVSVWF